MGAFGNSPKKNFPKKRPPNPQISVTFGGLGVWGPFFGGGSSEPLPNFGGPQTSPKHTQKQKHGFDEIFLAIAAT